MGLGAVALLVVLVVGAAAGGAANPPALSWAGSADAVADIPAEFLALYQAAAARVGIPWQLVAAVGKIECDHGRGAGCDRPNGAGAVGPMQFLPATFAAYAHASGSAQPSITDPRDAIFAAAALLAADGAPGDPARAFFAYNHDRGYVAEAVAWALVYGWTTTDHALLGDAVVHHPHLSLRTEAAADVRAGLVDGRVLTVLLLLATTHRFGFVGPFVTGHSVLVAGTTRVSNHAGGRAVDLPVVDGAPVTIDNAAAHAVAEAVLALPVGLRPDELGSPWATGAADVRSFSEGHGDHLHIGYDG